MKRQKREIITFKVDQGLFEKLNALPNRSEFIRQAVLEALENICPLCQGTGFLSPNQKKHWEQFNTGHFLRQCDLCHEIYLVCGKSKPEDNLHGCALH